MLRLDAQLVMLGTCSRTPDLDLTRIPARALDPDHGRDLAHTRDRDRSSRGPARCSGGSSVAAGASG